MVDDVLMYKGRQAGPKVVPTSEQVFDLQCGAHMGVTGKHSTDFQKLVGVLSQAGMSYPMSLVGLKPSSESKSYQMI